MSTGNKFHKDKLFAKVEHTATTGVVGNAEYEVLGEIKLSIATTFTTSGTLTLQGRIKHSSSWQNIGTLTSGGDFDTFDIDAYDFVRFNFTVAAGSTGEIAASGFFKAASAGSGAAFTTIQTDSGTSPVATGSDTLTVTSSDSSVSISGNSTTDTVDITLGDTLGPNTFYADSNASTGGDGSILKPYDSLQDAIDAAELLSDSVRKTIVVAGDSAFDEDITIKGGVLSIIGLGPFNIGDDAQTYKDSTTARNVLWELGDTTLPLSLRPTLRIGVLGQGDSSSTHPAAATACKISGTFTIDKGSAGPTVSELWMSNVKVKGALGKGASLAGIGVNMYFDGCFFDSTFVGGSNFYLVEARNCEFDSLIDINSYCRIFDCEVSAGMTLAGTSPLTYIKPNGIYQSTLSGVFTGISGSDILVDSSTNYKYTANGASLAGSATKTVMTENLSNPMTTSGDIIYGGASGAPTRLAKGADTEVLTLTAGVPSWAAPGVGGGGDVTGPASSVDNAIVRFNGTTGKIIQDYTSGAPTISDTGKLSVTSSSAATFNRNSETGTEVIGDGATSGGIYSTVFGYSADTTATQATAIGGIANSASKSVSLGYNAVASAANCVAIGHSSSTAGDANSVAVGYGATTSGIGGVSLGHGTSTGANSVAVGRTANASGTAAFSMGYVSTSTGSGSVSIGNSADATNTDSISIGRNSTSSGVYSLCIGYASTASHKNSVVIGNSFSSTAINQMILGNVYDVWLGKGVTNVAPVATSVCNTGGSGTDIAGADFVINASQGTGTGVGGHIVFKTAAAGTTGSALNTLTTQLELTDDGNVIMANLPTSAAGLPTGALWNNSNVINIV